MPRSRLARTRNGPTLPTVRSSPSTDSTALPSNPPWPHSSSFCPWASRSASSEPRRSAHLRRFQRQDLVEHADFGGRPVRVRILAHVLFGHLVDVRVGPVLGDGVDL